MKKIIFLLPGFGQKTTNKRFSWLIKFLRNKGFKVVGVPIEWRNRTNSECANDFKEFYIKNKSEINYVLGFSYGAVITFLTAEDLKPNKIFLCSLSPDFKEDSPKMKLWIRKYIGKKRFQDTQTRSARNIAKSLTMPVILFYGEKEGQAYPALKKRVEETAKLAKNSKLIIIPNAPHDIDNTEYKKAIINEFHN